MKLKCIVLFCMALTTSTVIREAHAQTGQDLPAVDHGRHYTIKLSLLPEIELDDMRAARPARADLSAPERCYLIVFLRADLTVDAIRNLNTIRHIVDQYPPTKLSVDYVFTDSAPDSILELLRAGLLAGASDVYLDRAGKVTNQLNIPTSFPFAFLIRGGTRQIIYSWGTPIEGLAGIFAQVMK